MCLLGFKRKPNPCPFWRSPNFYQKETNAALYYEKNTSLFRPGAPGPSSSTAASWTNAAHRPRNPGEARFGGFMFLLFLFFLGFSCLLFFSEARKVGKTDSDRGKSETPGNMAFDRQGMGQGMTPGKERKETANTPVPDSVWRKSLPVYSQHPEGHSLVSTSKSCWLRGFL